MGSFLVFIIVVLVCYMIVRKRTNFNHASRFHSANNNELTEKANIIIETKLDDLMWQALELDKKCELSCTVEGHVDSDFLRRYVACVNLCEEKLNYLKRFPNREIGPDFPACESTVRELRKRVIGFSTNNK